MIRPLFSLRASYPVSGPHDSREAAGLRGKFSNHIHEGAVCRVAYVADLDTVVTCGMDGKVHFFDLSKRLLLRTFGGHGDHAVFSFAYCTRYGGKKCRSAAMYHAVKQEFKERMT